MACVPLFCISRSFSVPTRVLRHPSTPSQCRVRIDRPPPGDLHRHSGHTHVSCSHARARADPTPARPCRCFSHSVQRCGAEFIVLASLVASACAFVPQPALVSRSKIGMSKQLETPKVAMSLELSSLEQMTQSLAGVVAVDGGTGDGNGSNTRHTGLQSVNSL